MGGEGPTFDAIETSAFVVVDWTAGPETSRERPIAGLHLHHEDDEAWLVLAGRLGFRVGDEELEIGPGESIVAVRGVPHSFWNAGGGPARYLLVMTPRLKRLIDALHAGGRTDYAEIFREHASELLV